MKIINSVDVRTSFNRINRICRHHYGHQHRFGRHGNWRRHHLRPILRIQSKRQGQPSLETIDFFRNSYFYTDNPTMHSIQKTTFKPNLWIRKKNVMDNSLNYLFITALSYPFIALYNADAASFRTSQNSRLPMVIALGSNILNILENFFFVFTLSLGVAQAALSTLLSRIISALIILILLKQPKLDLYVDSYLSIRSEIETITKILKISIPTGIENGKFQFGKLVIPLYLQWEQQPLPVQAMVSMLESFACQASIGIGLGMMTVVGKCVDAKEYEQARQYTISLTKLAWMVCIIFCAIIMLFIQQITSLAKMESESAKLAIWLTRIVFAYKMIFWTPSFLPGYGLRAAGDVKFSMITSTLSMWICRVVVTIFLVHTFHMGL